MRQPKIPKQPKAPVRPEKTYKQYTDIYIDLSKDFGYPYNTRSGIALQNLITQIPEGVSHNDVLVVLDEQYDYYNGDLSSVSLKLMHPVERQNNYYDREMISYEKKVKVYDQKVAQYNADLEQYNKDKIAYDEWKKGNKVILRDKEIELLKKKLSRLEKQKRSV